MAAYYQSDIDLAANVATSVGLRLLEMQETLSDCDPEELGHRGDLSAHELISSQLMMVHPNDVVLSEEGIDDGSRLFAPRVWLVDPLDGTRDFSLGRKQWAVQIAIWTKEARDITAAVVYIPAFQVLLKTKDAIRYKHSTNLPPSIAVSRTRAPSIVARLAQQTGSVIIGAGSVGFKVWLVICGRADAYVHAGSMHEWDTAAPVAVARAADLHVSRFDGTSIAFNTPSAITDQILVCRPEIADTFIRILGENCP